MVARQAYEEYGQLMVEMARFIKPILAITPPDLTSRDPLHCCHWRVLHGASSRCPAAGRVQLMTMSASDFLDQWFETDSLKATMSASGIIGTYQGVKSPGTAYVLLHHYMGEIDGAFRAWGIPKGGTGGVSNAIGNAARALGAEIRTDAPVASVIVKGGRAVGVALESGEEIHADSILSSFAPDVPGAARGGHARSEVRGGGSPLQVPRLVRQGQPRGRPAARLQLPARRRRAPARGSFSPSIDEMETA
jgi:phytoene dehydrogenase-like protein